MLFLLVNFEDKIAVFCGHMLRSVNYLWLVECSYIMWEKTKRSPALAAEILYSV